MRVRTLAIGMTGALTAAAVAWSRQGLFEASLAGLGAAGLAWVALTLSREISDRPIAHVLLFAIVVLAGVVVALRLGPRWLLAGAALAAVTIDRWPARWASSARVIVAAAATAAVPAAALSAGVAIGQEKGWWRWLAPAAAITVLFATHWKALPTILAGAAAIALGAFAQMLGTHAGGRMSLRPGAHTMFLAATGPAIALAAGFVMLARDGANFSSAALLVTAVTSLALGTAATLTLVGAVILLSTRHQLLGHLTTILLCAGIGIVLAGPPAMGLALVLPIMTQWVGLLVILLPTRQEAGALRA